MSYSPENFGQGHEARNVRWHGKWHNDQGNCVSKTRIESRTRHVPVLLTFDQAAQFATGQLTRQDLPERMMPVQEYVRIIDDGKKRQVIPLDPGKVPAYIEAEQTEQ